MTKADWLKCTEPQKMLQFLQGKASDRKLRLFACACCRKVWHLVKNKSSRKAIETSERYADGLACKQDVAAARRELKADYRNKHRAALASTFSEATAFGWALGWDMAHYTVRAKSSDAAKLALLGFTTACDTGLGSDASQGSRPIELLHHLFDEPSVGLIVVDSAWLAWNHGIVPKLAQRIYDERRFSDLPILADTLEEAGCTDADILAHCRGPGPHVRGCWVVDLILGKQ